MVEAFMPLNVELKGLIVVIDVEGSPAIQWGGKMTNLAEAYNYQPQGKNAGSYFLRNRWARPKKFGLRRVT